MPLARLRRPVLAEPALEVAAAERSRFVARLQRAVRFPSVSSLPEHADDVRGCAAWLAAELVHIGLVDARVVPTSGHPVVVASWRRDRRLPTVLVYGHYDVQPVEPLTAWAAPPFSAHTQGAHLYGRGASDDKGQFLVHVAAVDAYLRSQGSLPVNVVFLLEGEEETGSRHIEEVIDVCRPELEADVALVSDMAIPSAEQPAITYGLRGALGLEVVVRALARDVHSGQFGGAVPEPAQALASLLAGLHDHSGRVAVHGFYDRVRTWGAAERAFMAVNGPSDRALLQAAGARAGWGEPGFTAYERATIRPSVTVSGLDAGDTGAGGRAVVPSQASAKLTIRLACDQQPDVVDRLVRCHLNRHRPPAVDLSVTTTISARPASVDRRHPGMRAAAEACAATWGRPPVFLRSGGTIPVVAALQDALRVPVVLMGFGLASDRIHAPNERAHLPTLGKGVDASIRFIAGLAGMVGGVPCR